ncbi:phosphatidate cytidylyltransferase [Candidatus Pelagibacter sp.]|jgi:phosphatidate cytidylyltransferase|nr:phosphatidate cytidylyltransferase [Candidatus Pelagibacter sp.]
MSQNLLKRIITSIILLSLLFFISFSHQNVFIMAILIIGLIICVEANSLFSKLLFTKILKKNLFFDKFNLKFIIFNIIVFCYIFFIFCGLSYEIHKSEGAVFFLYIISICFFTDIGGYVVGKTIGGKKLSKISPNKTISGTIGSFLFSIIPLLFLLNIVYLDLTPNFSNILFCLLISLVSQSGDLFISFLKRKAKIKDTGKILPGHGGVLDRLDGIIFAVPFSYLLLKFF